MTTNAKATWTNEKNETCYDWPAIEAAARAAGLDVETVKDWVFEGVTDTLTADEIVAAFRAERE